MYKNKNYTKDEIAMFELEISAALIWCIFVDLIKISFLRMILIPIFIISLGYLFFNRQIKFIARIIHGRKDYYPAKAAVTEVRGDVFNNPFGKSSAYDVTVIEYQDNGGKIYTEDLHNYFAVHKLSEGERATSCLSRVVSI